MNRLATGIVIAASSLAVTALHEPAFAQSIPATTVAEMFCMGRTVDPSLAAPYLAPDLVYATEKALARNVLWERDNPGEKGPLGDGIPWQSFPDRADQCTVDYAASAAEPMLVPVTYAIAGAPDAGWTDTLVLEVIDGEWKIVDVRYENDADSLAALLAAAFD